MEKSNPEMLRERITVAVNEMLKRGHVLRPISWLVNRDGTWCGCPIGMAVLYEKGEEAGKELERRSHRMCPDDPYEFVMEQLNLNYWDLWAFIHGFDDCGKNYLPKFNLGCECAVYDVGRSFREMLPRE